MTLRNIISFSGIVCSFLLISGCSSFPNMASGSSTTANIEQRESMGEMLKHMQEWEDLKPGLVRLVKKESELSFLLSELEGMANVQTFDNDFVDISGKNMVSQQTNLPASSGLQDMASALDASAPLTQIVEVASASPIRRNLAENNKFSNSSLAPPKLAAAFTSASAASQTIPKKPRFIGPAAQQSFASPSREQAVSASKFQEKNVANIVGSIDECAANLNNSGDTAIHLVSYKSSNYVEKGWQELSAKHKAVLCGKQPIVANVTVKGVDYHSLRVGPYSTVSEAQNACKKLRDSGQYCAVTEFSGKRIEQL